MRSHPRIGWPLAGLALLLRTASAASQPGPAARGIRLTHRIATISLEWAWTHNLPRDGVYKGPVEATSETPTFIPYGCTKLRVVALPVIPNP